MPLESVEKLTAFAERLASQLPDGFRSIARELSQRWLIVNDTEAIQAEIEDLGGYWHVALSPGDVGVEMPAADPLVERLIRTLGSDQIWEVSSKVGPIATGRWYEFADGTPLVWESARLDEIVPRLPAYRRNRTLVFEGTTKTSN